MLSKHRFIYDVETLYNVFTITFIDYDTNEITVFEISRRKNELPQLRKFFSSIKYLIGFNSVSFDNPVTGWLLQQSFGDLSGEEIANKIYTVAQILINQSDNQDLCRPIEKCGKFKHCKVIDLFLFYSKNIRISKKLSLKSFAVNLDMTIQEMPIDHSQQYLTDNEIDMVISYNINDVLVTKKLAERLKEEINLRVMIEKDYGIQNTLIADAPKIASNLLLKLYCEQTGENENDIRNTQENRSRQIAIKDLLVPVTFQLPEYQALLADIQQKVVTGTGELNYNLILTNPNGTKFHSDIKSGGIHGLVGQHKIIPKEDELLLDIDIGSQYPTAMVEFKVCPSNLNPFVFLPLYKNILNERLSFKALASKYDKEGNTALANLYTIKQTVWKLILNSTYGQLGSEYSYMYSIPSVLKVTINNQLLICKLTEQMLDAQVNIIMQNTDGILILLKKSQLAHVQQIIKAFEKTWHFTFEEKYYKAAFFRDVNNYLMVSTSGKVKEKGVFISDKVLDGRNEFLVIAKAVKAYLVDSIPVDYFIKNHKNIYDFCAAKKIDKSYTVYYNGEKQQKLNRYFVSTIAKGSYLYKQKKDKTTLENVLKNTPIYILNEQTSKPIEEYPVNYTWYIQKAKEIIELFEPKQLELFL